ncbi:GTPase Era [Helicobacter mesocricetorum]|uniref:GTPase Era n=1 Tax=Helicobacter mesocricetorum TaxID=87012 RepID=UPI000CF0FCEF|nr:GTPase Era [Helicobacter mesocricetorum]
MDTKAGFVAVIGRPNAGKSTLLNTLLGEKLALVSHKVNATRKRMNLVFTQDNVQMIFVDTPGIDKQEKMLNAFMLKEAIRAMQDCDFLLFLSPIHDKIDFYREFLENIGDKPHILLLTKVDTASKEEILKKIKEYEQYQDFYKALIPVSYKDNGSLKKIIEVLAGFMPKNPFYYDNAILSPNTIREIAKEMIRESCFNNLSEELPYESDVIVKTYREKLDIDYIKAEIIVLKQSQKGVVIGKNATTLKRIGKEAREIIERFLNKKIYLELIVKVVPNWNKEKDKLKKIGYNLED